MTDDTVTLMSVTTDKSLEKSLNKFWETEELPNVQHLSTNEVQAEEMFVSSVNRLVSRRFIVNLPYKHPRLVFGDFHGMILNRFHNLKQRLA